MIYLSRKDGRERRSIEGDARELIFNERNYLIEDQATRVTDRQRKKGPSRRSFGLSGDLSVSTWETGLLDQRSAADGRLS